MGLCNASGTLPLDFEQGVDVDDFDAILTAVQRQTEAFRYDELSGLRHAAVSWRVRDVAVFVD